MKKKLREILRMILALFFYGSGLAFMRASLRRRQEPLVRILLVHHIKEAAKFERMLRFLVAHYHIISFDDLVEKRFAPKKINVLLSLDDGYASWFESGLPIIEKYDFPVLLFVSSGFIEVGESNASQKFLRENLKLSFHSKPLTEQMTQKLASHPLVEIGGHTRTHPFLTTLPQHLIKQEIAEDREVLNRKTERPVRVFAYPFGDYDDKVRAETSAEYGYAMTTHSNFYSPRGDPLTIPRSNHGTVNDAVLGMWVLGAFDLAEMTIASIKRFLNSLICRDS